MENCGLRTGPSQSHLVKPVRVVGTRIANGQSPIAKFQSWRAAHKAVRAAGVSPARDETNVPVVITDLSMEQSWAGKLGRKSPVRSGASELAGRSIK